MAISRRAALGLLVAAPMIAARRKTQPNVVLFVADDLGYGDIASYGCPDIRTPNIDRIGAQGVRFANFYTNAPECTPTRTALLTGRYQHRVGGLESAIGIGNVGRYDDAEWLAARHELGLPTSEISMPRMFKNAGYDTGCFGKWHLGYEEKFSPNAHGFDEYFGLLGGAADYFNYREQRSGPPILYHNGKPAQRTGYTTDLFGAEAIRWLKERTRNRPFFLYVPFNAPHTPIQDPDEYDPKTNTAPRRQGNRKVYAKMVEREDRRIGDVLAQLEAMGAAENTIVIFHSDNGADDNGRNLPWRGRKGTMWEGGIHVPCVMRWPGVLPAGKTVEQVTATMDLLPTLIAATGIAAPEGRKFDGINVLPALTGTQKPFGRTLFWRSKRGTRLRKAVREGDMKLVIDEGREELHDLARDPYEKSDLLPQAEPVAARLRARLANWEKEVVAPRLRPFRTTPG
jgi:N-acetylgalactosamine-6-sulfatase